MQTRLKSLIPCKSGVYFVELFGYATRGLPGLELIAPKVLKRSLREKMIFVTKSMNLEIPLRRYVLCVDLKRDDDSFFMDFSSLELPIYLMYMVLSGNLSLANLESCLIWGGIGSSGEISVSDYPLAFLDNSDDFRTLIAPRELGYGSGRQRIDLEDLFPLQQININSKLRKSLFSEKGRMIALGQRVV